MITGGKMELHVESLSERPEEMGDELRASIGSDMSRNSVLRENVNKEKMGELRRGNRIVGWNEDPLLRQTVYYNQDGCKSLGVRKLFNEVHGN
jgi:hypothetical protein